MILLLGGQWQPCNLIVNLLTNHYLYYQGSKDKDHKKEKKGELDPSAKKRANSNDVQTDVPVDDEDHISEENLSPDVDENWSGTVW